MIVLKLELWPMGDESRKRSLGHMTISNIGTSPDRKRGTYLLRLFGKQGRHMATGHVHDWPRLRFHAWNLVHEALTCLGRDARR